MLNIKEFIGHFGDFYTLAHDTDLENFVVRRWNETGDDATFYYIIGSVPIGNELFLIVTTAEGVEDHYEAVEKYGVSIIAAKEFFEYGIEIRPNDQEAG